MVKTHVSISASSFYFGNNLPPRRAARFSAYHAYAVALTDRCLTSIKMSRVDKSVKSHDSQKTDSIENQKLPSIPAFEDKLSRLPSTTKDAKYMSSSKETINLRDQEQMPTLIRPPDINKYYAQRKAYSVPKVNHHGLYPNTRTMSHCYNLLYDKTSVPYIRKSKNEVGNKSRRKSKSYDKLETVKYLIFII